MKEIEIDFLKWNDRIRKFTVMVVLMLRNWRKKINSEKRVSKFVIFGYFKWYLSLLLSVCGTLYPFYFSMPPKENESLRGFQKQLHKGIVGWEGFAATAWNLILSIRTDGCQPFHFSNLLDFSPTKSLHRHGIFTN